AGQLNAIINVFDEVSGLTEREHRRLVRVGEARSAVLRQEIEALSIELGEQRMHADRYDGPAQTKGASEQ
ncbi:MAG: hypothetical protein JOZ24_04855, partial [Candidatus Eremiobacteraeota bacterium]|nr:hypothetical protein [Candidatus Eremiobacteraeota bacterium]